MELSTISPLCELIILQDKEKLYLVMESLCGLLIPALTIPVSSMALKKNMLELELSLTPFGILRTLPSIVTSPFSSMTGHSLTSQWRRQVLDVIRISVSMQSELTSLSAIMLVQKF